MRYTEKEASAAGKRARLKQMKGRAMLNALVANRVPSDNASSYYGYTHDAASRILSSFGTGTEYQSAMALMGLHRDGEAIRLLGKAEAMRDNSALEKEKADAALRILSQPMRHKEALDWICMLQNEETKAAHMDAYALAFAGALKAGAEEKFLSMDGIRLARSLAGMADGTYWLFQLLPFFERAEYICHAAGNRTTRTALTQADPADLSAGQKQTLCSSGFLQSRILRGVSRYSLEAALSICAGNREAFLFLAYLAKMLPAGTWDDAVGNAGNITDSRLCIQALEPLEGSAEDLAKAAMLMAKTGYDRGFIKALGRKTHAGKEEYIRMVRDLHPCAMAAWILGRDDVLGYTGSAWWDSSYEDAALHAMLHKWDRFLKGLAGNGKLRETAAYLGTRCSQINANMLSDSQLEQVRTQDLLPAQLPEWMRPATYDQLLAYREIRSTGSRKLKDALEGMFQVLSRKLRPETAGKRMLQFAQALKAAGAGDLSAQEAQEAVSCLTEKDLYAWAADTFAFKPSHALAAMALPHIRENGALKEAGTEQDAWFILRNPELCRDGLEKAKKTFCQTDRKVLELKEKLHLEEGFYQRYKKESTEFLLASTDIAAAYMDGMGEAELAKFRLVVKAAMCGKLGELKFHDGDLADETGMPVGRNMADAWIEDLDIPCRDKFHGHCAEDSSFNGIMSIGARPGYTCMNYKDGAYRECLMSYFDANKKILYRMDGQGKTAARAVLRLTKVTEAGTKRRGGPDFVDVEDAPAAAERPALFLERMYSGYQGKDRAVLAGSIIAAAKEKAARMGIALILALDYEGMADTGQEGFHKETLSVYITKSKSSAQYLDSFGGKKTYSSGEDTYMEADCLVCREPA